MTEVTRFITCPIEVFNDDRIDATEKILFMRIDSFCRFGDGDGCYATNEYLADFCGCSDRKISASLTKLKQLGYIEQLSFDGRKRTLWSRLADISHLPSKICDTDSQNMRTENIEPSNKKRNICKKPSRQEVRDHVKAKGYHFNADEFYDYYDSANWHKADGKAVKNWKQCCVTWESNRKDKTPQKPVNDDRRKRLE